MAKKKKSPADADASTTTNESAASPEQTEPMVTVLKTGTAAKLSPRGGGQLTYQVGRVDDTVVLRISANDSSGRFSAEWVAVDAIRQSLAKLPANASSFKGAVALRSAWKGQSSCNSGFGAAILRAESVFVGDPDPKKKGMLKLATPDALDVWEKQVLALQVPPEAPRLLLHPPKAMPNFAKRAVTPGVGDTPAEGSAPEGEAVDGDDAAPDEEAEE